MSYKTIKKMREGKSKAKLEASLRKRFISFRIKTHCTGTYIDAGNMMITMVQTVADDASVRYSEQCDNLRD
ncbi:hypothetical protein L6452_40397 [Arctium lappa]|uniref:Uncharacterized protein n=1 Tax=Arctium lappa TaxID=4217 RepID=A0ACB8XMM8_ARCLA|nr:hypothetical protein L6452_40397 [Arctium lappa]